WTSEDLGGFSDFFASIFGDAVRGGRSGRTAGAGRGGFRMEIPGSDVEAQIPVTVDDLMRGGKRRITIDGRGLDVDLPIGVRDGTVLRLAGQGEAGTNGAPAGDLF